MQPKNIFFAGLLLTLISLGTQAQDFNHSIDDPVRKRPVLVDYVDRDGLKTGEFALFYDEEYNGYRADAEVLSQLGILLGEDIHLIIVLATWCGDSKREVPRFLKLLDELGFPDTSLTMIGVDSHKQAYEVDIEHLEVEYVPTFIVFRHDTEIGRIVEIPIVSLEADLLQIVN
jgi:thiol-disulfide isomerase/thioredoxin